MPYVTITEFDIDWAGHVKIDEAIGAGPFDGLQVHASGPCEDGVRVIDIWDSKEHAQRFFAEEIAPALASLGIEGGPPRSFTEFDVAIFRT